ncbi:MAG: hypothetical protein CBE11_00530 [Rickettsiales bacterium TMED251]|nr:MAG: hypothetical protein CBE11_00530 [Rickettsiales bacterium TMED251]
MNSENILKVNILYEKIAVFTLTNPNRRNPLSLSLIYLLQKELDKIKKNKTVKVLVIQSTGPSFCSGHDLKEVEKFSKSKVKLLDLFNKCSKMMLSIRKLTQPVIACVDGLASAAGCQLVASCDLVIASKSSKFQTPGVNIGLFCSTPMVAVSRKLATKDMMFMLLSGQVIKAEEAKNFKLVNKVVTKPLLQKEVMKIAMNISKKSTQSIIIGKEAFYNQLEMSIEDAYRYTAKVMAKNMEKYDAKEGIKAFIEKRSPVWKDKM